jgi:undecaprenyl-diphosphatase
MRLDLALFHAGRRLAGKSHWGDALIVFAATWLFYLLLLIAIVGTVQGDTALVHHSLRVLFVTVIALIVAEAISWTTSLFWFRTRPFERLHFTPLVWMPPHWKSFPSDHTTIGFTIACTFLFLHHPLAPVLVAAATLVAIARVIAGVHYPSDVAAGVVLAGVVSFLTVLLTRSLPLL